MKNEKRVGNWGKLKWVLVVLLIFSMIWPGNIVFASEQTEASVTITNTVLGGNTEKEFTFTVELTNSTGNALAGPFTYQKNSGVDTLSLENGGTITLKHGDSISIQGLPVGAQYKVTATKESGYLILNGETILPDGILSGEIVEEGSLAAFTNIPTVPAMLTLSGTKKLIGKTLQENDFSFEVLDETGTVISTVGHNDAGKIQFENISLTDIGTYTYTVREAGKGTFQNNILYSSKEYTIIAVVAGNNQGQLSIQEVKVDGETVTAANGVFSLPDAEEGATFTNRYTPDAVGVTFGGTIQMSGRPLKVNEFNFEIVGEDNEVIATAGHTANGSIQFEPILLSQEGTFSYQVREKDGGTEKNGVQYDETTYDVRVVVSDRSSELKAAQLSANAVGDLVIENVYINDQLVEPKEGVYLLSANKASFTNVYTPLSTTSILLGGTKTLTGKTLTANMFKFEVLKDNVRSTVSQDAKGKILFEKIEFSEVGEHKLTVREKDGGKTLNGIRYDDTTYAVKAIVEDDGKGNLILQKVFVNEKEVTAVDGVYPLSGKTATFTNRYTAIGTDVKEGSGKGNTAIPTTGDRAGDMLMLVMSALILSVILFFGKGIWRRRAARR